MNCKYCQKEIIQPEGKRTKEFCNTSCRSNFWYGQNKKGKSLPKKKEAAPIGLTPPMPVREKNEDVFDFAIRKNQWKRLYNK